MRTLIVTIAIVLLIILLFAFSPWLMGSSFQDQYTHDLNVLAKSSNANIQVLEFRKGFRNSFAKVSVEPNIPEAKNLKVIVEQTITHGPIVYDYVNNTYRFATANIRTVFHLDPMIERMILSFSNAQPGQAIIEINTVKNFGGSYSSSFKTIGIATQMPGVGNVTWSGIKGTVNFNIVNDHPDDLKSDIVIGALNASDNKAVNVVTSDLTFQGAAKYNPIGLWSGHGEMNLPLFSLTQPDAKNFKLENFKLIDHFGPTGNFYNFDININIDKLSLPETLVINPFSFAIDVKNFDAKTMLQLTKNNEQRDPSEQQKQMLQLFTPSTKINGNSVINTNTGKATADFDFNWVTTNFPQPVTAEGLYNTANFKITLRSAITLVNYLVEEADKMKNGNASADSMNTKSSAPDKDTMLQNIEKEINQMVEQGKINKETGDKLVSLQKAELSVDVYSSSLDQLVSENQIPQPLADTLKADYVKAFAPPPAPSTSDTKNPTAQDQLNDLLQKGYVVKDGEDYVTVITGEQGKIKINNVDYKNGVIPAPTPTSTSPKKTNGTSSTTTTPGTDTTTPTTVAPETDTSTPATTSSPSSNTTNGVTIPAAPTTTAPATGTKADTVTP